MKAMMVMPALLLQRPHPRSKVKNHIRVLEDRLMKWTKGDLESLLHECQTVQSRLKVNQHQHRDGGKTARSFEKLVAMGNVKAAVRLITEHGDQGCLPLDGIQPDGRTVMQHLTDKHPPGQPADHSTISDCPPREGLCFRYGWTPKRLPSHCPYGEAFSVAHMFSRQKGALPSIRHNRVRDITAQLLTEVCPNVRIEPTPQPLTGESFPLRSTYVEEGARLDDIRAQDFLDSGKSSTFFNVRVFNSQAPSNNKSSTSACYRRHEKEKRREYERRILEVEHRPFTPLVLSTSGGWDH